MTPEDFATILNAHDCTPVYKRMQVCGKHGAIEVFNVHARRRNNESRILIGQWSKLNELSYEQVRALVAEKLRKSEVAS